MIDWPHLVDEFSRYQLPEEVCSDDFPRFTASLIRPAPRFVGHFLSSRAKDSGDRDRLTATLYFFLLEKRYSQRLNLLHFAFHIFDEETRLPPHVIDRTPFPHEEGVPLFRHFGKDPFDLFPCAGDTEG